MLLGPHVGTLILLEPNPFYLLRQGGRIEEFLERRPLLVPAVLLGIIALLLLWRGPRIAVVRPQTRRDA